MQVEYEATYLNINRDEMSEKLKEIGAKLVRPEFMQKRIPFYFPNHDDKEDRFIRVRDEGDKITMTLKIFEGDKIEDQKEINLVIDDFQKGVEILNLLGCEGKSYQETKREIWALDGVEIMIDEWPFLEPFVEIEGKSEEEVKNVSKKLGFDYSEALFCSADVIYAKKYGIPKSVVNSTPEIKFEMENPFAK